MLDISNISEKDKLFNFMARLQPWAQTKLRWQDVRNLTSVLAVAKRFLDNKAACVHWQKKKMGADRKIGQIATPHLAQNCPNKESAATLIINGGSQQRRWLAGDKHHSFVECHECRSQGRSGWEGIADDPNALEVFMDLNVHSSGDITVLLSMMDASPIVEMDEEMMPFLKSHSQTLEEVEIAAAHLTVSICAKMLLGRKFDLYTTLVLGERDMFAAFKPFSQ
ncbi:hypothetical protein M0R45_008758 [Rubus argutus]|uniref:Uncharacterized protein n=1 Tax=Rubus argutus TaxID=59490 RepID=A0AAW1Y4N1_RUBAR